MKDWFRVQLLAYESAAQYQLAKGLKQEVLKRSEGYGQIISRLRRAKLLSAEATELARKRQTSTDLASLTAAISAELEMFEKDNASIYLEAIPSNKTLSPLQKACAVQITVVDLSQLTDDTNALLAESKDCNSPAPTAEAANLAFSSLYPQDVRILVDEYKTSGLSLLEPTRRAVADLSHASKMLTLRINLSHKAPTEVPESIRANLRNLQLKGGVRALEERLSAVELQEKVCRTKLVELSAALKQAQEGSSVRSPGKCSTALRTIQNFWKFVNSFDEKLTVSIAVTSRVRQKMQQSAEFHPFLDLTWEDLHKRIKTLSSGDSLESLLMRGGTSPLAAKQNELLKIGALVAFVKKRLAQMEEVFVKSQKSLFTSLMQARKTREPTRQSVILALTELSASRLAVLEAVREAEERMAKLKANLKLEDETRMPKSSRHYMALAEAVEDLLLAHRDSQEGTMFFACVLDSLQDLHHQILDSYPACEGSPKNLFLPQPES